MCVSCAWTNKPGNSERDLTVNSDKLFLKNVFFSFILKCNTGNHNPLFSVGLTRLVFLWWIQSIYNQTSTDTAVRHRQTDRREVSLVRHSFIFPPLSDGCRFLFRPISCIFLSCWPVIALQWCAASPGETPVHLSHKCWVGMDARRTVSSTIADRFTEVYSRLSVDYR